MFTISGEILDYFRSRHLGPESQGYIGTHAKRYAFLLSKVAEVRAELLKSRPALTILDIGPSFFTELLRVALPKDDVFTLGFDGPNNRGGHFPESTSHDKNHHFHFDLNDAQYSEKWIKIPPVDLVIMAEVLEHLYTAPTLVLRFVRSLMSSGGFLIIETPNAASLKKRLKLFIGRHPYEMIRETRENPGHFREYTKAELLAIARSAGFDVRSLEMSNYFSHDSSKGSLQRLLRSAGPPDFRRGITMILEKPAR